MLAGVVPVMRTLGPRDGTKALVSATWKHLSAIRRGEGLYPEKGKQRIWFKLAYLKHIYDYLIACNEEKATERFGAIINDSTVTFIGHLMPRSDRFTKDFMLHHAWQELIRNDYNIVAEVSPPAGDSVSLHVRRCFINEVVRDVGLMPVGDRICYGDVVFWKDRHPCIEFSRTKTLLAGDDCCNHTLRWKGDESVSA
jgi:hypothetical protein